MKSIDVKTQAQHFGCTWDNRKPWEIRYYPDRDYRVGDILVQHEYDGNVPTGRVIEQAILHILWDIDFPVGIKQGYCILSLAELRRYTAEETKL